jgi:hypothetical protein
MSSLNSAGLHNLIIDYNGTGQTSDRVSMPSASASQQYMGDYKVNINIDNSITFNQ